MPKRRLAGATPDRDAIGSGPEPSFWRALRRTGIRFGGGRARAVLGAAALAGCLAPPGLAETPEQTLSRATEAEGARTNRVIFVCPQGALLTVEFVTSDPAKPAVVRTPDGGQVSLPAQESGSGYRYADGARELRGKGREVTWTDGSRPPVVCTERTPPAGGTEPE